MEEEQEFEKKENSQVPANGKLQKPFHGFFYALISSIFFTNSAITIKKNTFFNGFDISFTRYITMILCGSLIAKYKGLPIFSSEYPNRILCSRALSGFGMTFGTLTMTLIDPSDAVSLKQTNIIFIAILSRIIFKEKFTIIQLIAFAVIFTGVIFITQPAYIFSTIDQVSFCNGRDR